MRWYWTKIALGALVVFGVGYTGYSVVSRAVGKGKDLFDSANPITIPLAFVPFSLDGRQVGTFQRVTIRRTAPKVPSGIDIRVKLAEGADVEWLRACRLTTVHAHDFDVDEGFRCLEVGEVSEQGGLVNFGEVRFRGSDGETILTVPLLVDPGMVSEMRSDESSIVEARSRLTAAEAELVAAKAERAADVIRARADSIVAEVEAQVREAVQDPPPGGQPPQ